MPAHTGPRSGLRVSGRHARLDTVTGRRSRRRWTWALRITSAVVSFAVLVGSGVAWSTFRDFATGVTRIAIGTVPAATGAHAAAATRSTGSGTDQNILLIGDDHRPADASPALLKLLGTQEDGGGTNTDTMMILHIPADGSRATVISLPRDSWVDIPGYGHGKLNSAFSDGSGNGAGDAGGARLLIQTVQDLTGLTIDHFVRVSMVGFYDIAQVLGPIQVCLNQASSDSYSGSDLPAGVSTLDAQQALAFVRQRHGLPRGDLDREVRQQYFLSTELRQVTTAGTLLNPLKLQGLVSSVSSALETDSGLDLLQLAGQFEDLSAGNVTFATIPTTGTPTITDGDGNAVSIVAVDTAAMPAFIAQVVGPPATYTAASPADPHTVTVQVVNGSGTNGLATASSAVLSGEGFHTLAPGGADTTSVTTVSYPAGDEAAAKAVVAAVPGAVAVQSSTVTAVTLTLGTDGHQPVAAAVAAPSAAAAAPTPTATGTASTAARAFDSASCIN